MPRALAILNGGNARAATVAAPPGSFIGGIIGWRGALFCVVSPALALALALAVGAGSGMGLADAVAILLPM